MIDESIIGRIERVIDQKAENAARPVSQSTAGTVTRVESDGTVWVRLAGASTDTPCRTTTAAVRPGDSVQVEVGGGSARITGNVSDPSAPSSRVDTVEVAIQGASRSAGAAMSASEAAQRAASEAEAVANATGQHFWYDDDGAHITDVTQEEWGDSTSPDYHSGFNSLFNSLGMLLRSALRNIAAFTHGSVAFYDGDGNDAENVTAMFGANGAQVGKSDESHVNITYQGLSLSTLDAVDPDDPDDDEVVEYFRVCDLRKRDGSIEYRDVWYSDGAETSYALTYIATDADYEIEGAYDIIGGVEVPIEIVVKATSGFTLEHAPEPGRELVAVYNVDQNSGDFDAAAARSFTFGNRGPRGIGASSFTAGLNNDATARSSVALGEQLVAGAPHQVVVGYMNEPVDSESWRFIVGGGYQNRSNCMRVRTDGMLELSHDDYGNKIIIKNGDDPNGAAFDVEVWVVEYGEDIWSLGSILSFHNGGSLKRRVYDGQGGSTVDTYPVRTDIADMLTTESHTASTGSISGGGTKWVTVNCAKSGWKLLGPVGYYFNGTGSGVTVGYALRRSSATECQMALKNNGTSAANFTLEIVALYVKNS